MKSRLLKSRAERALPLFLSFLLPFLIAGLAFAISGLYPFGDRQIFVNDGWHQYYPFLVAFRSKLLNGGSLQYDWTVGMGSNYLSIFAYYLSSPLYLLSALVPLRWLRDDVQEYAVEEFKSAVEFLEKHTGNKYDWDKLAEACEIWNAQNRAKFEKWEYNRTDIPPHTGATSWLYRIFEHQAVCGVQRALDNDLKVNKLLAKQVAERKFPKTVRYRAILWNTPCNNYANFNNWLLNCWGIDSVCEMIDIHGTEQIDTSSRENMLFGIAKMFQTSTMRAHTKGGYEVMVDDLWQKYAEYNCDMIILFDQISCKGVGAINGIFEEGAKKRGLLMCTVRQDLMDPTSISRRDMRADVNTFMQTVMNAEPLDPSLVDFDDDECW